jgi:pyruvate,water dikinase
LALEEQELGSLQNLPVDKQAEKLAEHAKKYFWLNNSFAAPQIIELEQFDKRLQALKEQKTASLSIPVPEKIAALIKKFNLNQEIIKQIEIIDYCTIWQDERKANVLKAIGYLGKILAEIGQRIKIEPVKLYYLAVSDFIKINSLAELKDLEAELNNRQEGSFFLIEGINQEQVVRGSDYRKLLAEKKELDSVQNFRGTDLHGSIANGGTAIGTVRICKNLSQIHKVQQGDILVASMTRPEYIQAIKKAAAIITDEGGITCHAAIVSRELNIPAVIGTKIATKVLKDGMKVEVKANHGLIRILDIE